MKIGIFFGGQSREREISLAGGRTVFDNLDRALFEPVLIFADSLGNFILIDPAHIQKTAIRDFYPLPGILSPADSPFSFYAESLGKLSDGELARLIALTGQKIEPSEFKKYIDFALIAMHGPYGEDGSIQGLFEWYNIPYSSCGLLSSAVGIDKIVQNQLMAGITGQQKRTATLGFDEWLAKDKQQVFNELTEQVGFPMVAKAPHQGSSIGVAIITEKDINKFTKAVNQCFFSEEIAPQQWEAYSEQQRIDFVNRVANLSYGIGFPLVFRHDPTLAADPGDSVFYHPEALLAKLNDYFSYSDAPAVLLAVDHEQEVLFEEFIEGQEFSCGVIQDEEGKAFALLPTEIVKVKEVFDFDSKYLPGATRKVLPIAAPDEAIRRIRQDCQQVFEALKFNACARIDGFLTKDGRVILHDPNTVPGMSPASLIFRQFSEIGLNITQALTYLVRSSLREREKSGKRTYFIRQMMQQLDRRIAMQHAGDYSKTKVAIVFGGFGETRQNSLPAARKAYSRFASSKEHSPVAVLLSGSPENPQLHMIPINLLFRDTVQEITEHLFAPKHPVVAETIARAEAVTRKYAGEFLQTAKAVGAEELLQQVGSVFVALNEELPASLSVLSPGATAVVFN